MDRTLKAASFATPIKESITTPTHNYGLRPSATISIIEIEVTLELKSISYTDHYNDGDWTIEKCFHGKSTHKVPTNKNPEEELTKRREKITKEAQKAALIECFKECLGFTKFNDMVFDELHRPMNV